jgi:hypothetical protein
MAVNESESMTAEFVQGTVDRTYIQLVPDRKNVENPPTDRLTWPTYRQAEQHQDPPFWESHVRRSVLPVEHKVGPAYGDARY